jgi:hypothetical protein
LEGLLAGLSCRLLAVDPQGMDAPMLGLALAAAVTVGCTDAVIVNVTVVNVAVGCTVHLSWRKFQRGMHSCQTD